MFDFPILSLLIWLPIAIGLILVTSNDISKSLSSTITLITTFIILLISLQLFQAYNHTSSDLQFIEKNSLDIWFEYLLFFSRGWYICVFNITNFFH